VDEQIGLILGVGGLGTSIAIDCCRMGFKKILLVDKDVIEFHNLNRQMLYNKDDLGKRKVERAAEVLNQLHNIKTEIVAVHTDAVENWDKIVELAKQSTLIFNTIDVSDYFSFAVASLAIKLKIPFVEGGTEPMYGHLMLITYSPPVGNPCWSCSHDLINNEVMKQLAPDKIESLKNITFIPNDVQYENGGSNAYTCSLCSHFMVAMMVESLFELEVPHQILLNLLGFEFQKWNPERKENCILCSPNASSITAFASNMNTNTNTNTISSELK